MPAGLEISGLGGFIIICGLGSEFAIFVGILLVVIDGGRIGKVLMINGGF